MEKSKEETKELEKFQQETLYHTISMTLVEGIKRLKLLPKERFTIHILGCSEIETDEPKKKYEKLFNYLKEVKELKSLNISLIGPRIPLKLHETKQIIEDFSFKIQMNFDISLYHDYFKKDCYLKPDLLFLPNAGIWVYDTWKDTLDLKLEGTPTIITSFAERDGKWDEMYLEYQKVEFIWKSQENPNGSLVINKIEGNYESKSNSWWICIKI